jgi:glycosyltransferase involved in cell wall biosynthesis
MVLTKLWGVIMKICFVFTVPIPEDKSDFLCNIPIRMRNLLKESSEIFVLYNGSINIAKLRDNGIDVYKIVQLPLLTRFVFFRLLTTAYSTYRLARKKHIDIFINANNHYYLFAAALGAKIAGKNIVARVTGILPDSSDLKYKKKLRKKIANFLAKLSLKISNVGICLSQYLKDVLVNKNISQSKLVVISQGVDTSMFNWRNQNTKKMSLLFVGRLEKIKGIEDVLIAYCELQNKFKELSLVICGNGSLQANLEKKYAHIKGIRFYGHTQHEQLPDIYAAADICILPSWSEGLPNVILEAMASGVAVVASNVGELPSLLGQGSRGILVTPGSVNQICEAVEKLITDAAFYQLSIENARQFVEREHSFSVLKEKYMRVFRSII